MDAEQANLVCILFLLVFPTALKTISVQFVTSLSSTCMSSRDWDGTWASVATLVVMLSLDEKEMEDRMGSTMQSNTTRCSTYLLNCAGRWMVRKTGER